MEDDNSIKNSASLLNKMAQSASSVIEAATEIAPVLVPFTNFLPLIKEIGNIFDEIIDLVEAAEHNKRTSKNIEKTFTELREEFDSCINLLSFSINVEIADELKEIKADQDDFVKYLQEMIAGIKTGVEDIGVNVKEVRDDVNDVGDNVKEVRDDVKDLRKEIKDYFQAVEIVHRDIRAENILITFNGTAKLANFKLSRYLTAATLNQKQNLERVRYCAPELLDRAPNFKYDQKCEVYSFGILLWEIAEERVPYQDSNDIVDITNKVRNKMYREPFSENSQMPEKFKQLEIEAVRHDPTFRPKITRMFEVLRYCVKDYFSKGHPLSQDSSSSSNSNLSGKTSTKPTPKRAYSIDAPDFESFKYMTLADAAKQHNLCKLE
ncbi:unnamed protein product [Rhizophagus irregularis]|nr:unnamed protein product [Rhizophagus irregularis]